MTAFNIHGKGWKSACNCSVIKIVRTHQ